MINYKLDEERKKYEGYVAYYKDLLILLNNIKFVTKKDGTPYQSIIKNIDISGINLKNVGVTCRAIYYSIKEGNELHFNFIDRLGKFQSYDIQLRTSFDIENVEPKRIIKEPLLTPYYDMNVEDLKKYIEVQKVSIQGWLDRDLKLLSDFDKAVKMAQKFEKDFKEKFSDDALWYIINNCF